MTEEKVTTYLGKGEYALTSKVLPKLVAVVKEYKEKGKWIWKMVDFLGVKADGTVTKRFADAKAVLKTVETEEAMELSELLENLELRKEVERTTRADAGEKAIKKAAFVERLKELGVAEDEIKSMVK